jgi:hypothetical protein
MPANPELDYNGYYHASAECWSVYTEVIGAEFGNAVLFGQVHMLTVDAYAVQHAGGRHPDKSVGVHLCGLHLVLEQGVAPPSVPRLIQRIGPRTDVWPKLQPPTRTGPLTVFDVALATSAQDHAERARRWARQVWAAWSDHHHFIANHVAQKLDSR